MKLIYNKKKTVKRWVRQCDINFQIEPILSLHIKFCRGTYLTLQRSIHLMWNGNKSLSFWIPGFMSWEMRFRAAATKIAPNLMFRRKPNTVSGCDWQTVKHSCICTDRVYNQGRMITSHQPHLSGCSVCSVSVNLTIRL